MVSGTAIVDTGAPSAVCGPGQQRATLKNVGPVAVRIGDRTVTWESGYLLAVGDSHVVEGPDIVYAIAPAGVFPEGRGVVDWVSE